MSEQNTTAQQDDADGFTLKDWAKVDPQMFDRFDVFYQHVHPIIEQLVAACKEHRLPCSVVVGHKQNETGSVCAAAAHLPSAAEVTPEVLLASVASRADVGEIKAAVGAIVLRAMKMAPGTAH